MKTFAEFLDSKNYDDDNLFRALKIALKKNKNKVIAFLEKLGATDENIRIELDKVNFNKQNLDTNKGVSQDDSDVDVIAPNNSDRYSSDF